MFRCVALCLALAAGELTCAVLFRGRLHHYEVTRRRMLGLERRGPPRAVGQPYLLYIPAPGYVEPSGIHHSPDGYRGQTVPRERSPGVARVVCLGGSTTYGWSVKDDGQTYPAWLQRVLAEDLPAGLRGVEVINAGLPAGTTAELLTHFHFKWRYYAPDVVVINTGGNDAYAVAVPHYSPDYSHYRRLPSAPEALAGPGRVVARSRLGALLLISLFTGVDLGSDEITQPRRPLAPWYTPPAGGIAAVPDAEYAFAVNLRTLAREIAGTGARVVLVPFRERPGSRAESDPIQPLLARNEAVLSDVAQEPGCALAPFPASTIPDEQWADWCHLRAEGCRAKAQLVAPQVRAALAR